jgi:hypothetical protein
VNCPFHALARTHTALICGMNLELLLGPAGYLTAFLGIGRMSQGLPRRGIGTPGVGHRSFD